MPILDRYIIRQFLGTFFFILVLIMAIAVVFDISEKTEDFARMTASLKEIVLEYYVNFVIFYSNLFSGLLIFIAVILFTGRLSHRSEVIAMLSSGVSFPRLLRPYFIAGTLLFLIALVVNHRVLPHANRTRLAFEEAHIRAAYFIKDKNLHREIGPGVIASVESFNWQKKTAYRFGLEEWRNGEMRSKLSAERASYDSLHGVWRVYDYMIREIGTGGGEGEEGLRDRIRRGVQLDTAIAMVPSDLGQRNENASSMNTGELDRFIAQQKAHGSDRVPFYLVEKHQRTSYPFATYVFTLIGVSVASRKVRGGTGVHLALGLLLVLVYIFAMKMSTVAATNAGLDPLVAVWLPNVLFTAVGAWIYRRAPK